MAQSYGSTDRPVALDLFQRITEVRWGGPDNVIEILYPDDSHFDFKRGDVLEETTWTPLSGGLAIGAKVTEKNGQDPDKPLVEVLFDEGNPIGPEIGGRWVWGFWYQTPVLMKPFEVPVVDTIDPNPFHDADQHAVDVWEAYWTNEFQKQFDDGNGSLPQAISDFENRYDKTRILTLTNWSDAARGGDPSGTKQYLYNIDPVLYSGLGSRFESTIIPETLSTDLVYQYAETTLATGTGGFAFTVNMKPVQTTMVEGDFWSPSYRRRDVFIINKKKLTQKIDIVCSAKSQLDNDLATGDITYYQGCTGDFTVASGRKLTFGKVAKTTVKAASFAAAEGTVLASFDGNGFVV